ncbi:hypothetical protein BJF78_28350 [Pseudonocardia sp. CNS-139]|nr:hypothetical protein BJF78_28350 [Pseudonocardia sp. CNS-139]
MQRAGLVLGLLGVVAVLGVVGTGVARGLNPPVTSTESMAFVARVPQLTVEVSSGDVTVRPADGDRVEVVRTVRGHGSPDPRGTETSGADGVSLAAGCAFVPFGRCEVDYDVRVPDGFTLDLRSGSGRVTAEGVTAAAVRVSVSSGDVRLADVRGPVELEVSSGEVAAERLDSPTFVARSSSGDLTLDFATAPTSLDVGVSSGEVEVGLPTSQPYRVHVDTGIGERAVTVPTADGAPNAVRVTTGAGDVTVRPR